MSLTKLDVLETYGVSPAAQISAGMEAEVYACGDDLVLKLYRGSHHLPRLGVLMDFYQSLERKNLPYQLPNIRSLTTEGDFCVTFEDRLPGRTMASLLPGLPPAAMDASMNQYLDAVLALSRLPIPAGFQRHRLFDMDGFSALAHGDWQAFLRTFLQRRLQYSGGYLLGDVADFFNKFSQLDHLLSRPYAGEMRLIHGDFFPGNLLVSETPPAAFTALLDFGLFTMQGDPLFDLATAWVLFDMYDDLKVNARQRLLAHITERLGAAIKGKLYRYVLIYSVLSANTYAPDCSDGHYRWCVENLNNKTYWAELT